MLPNSAQYISLIEAKIEQSLASFGSKTSLVDAIAYSLKNGGKRFRPALVLVIAKALKKEKDASDAALAVEFFHTASLIADDLPCMDDDDKRRSVPSLHKAFDEATALLASYALISAGYDRIRLNCQENPALLPYAIETACRTTGIFGATGGQYFDLYADALNEEVLKEVIDRKTGALFELSFVFGWLFGGGSLEKLPLVKKMSFHFGTAFQLADDFLDYQEDKEEGRINAPLIMGEKVALKWLEEELASFHQCLKELDLHSEELSYLADQLTVAISSAS